MLTSGFTGAPASKFLVFFIVVSSIIASITDIKYLFYIQVVPHLWRYKQVWRLLIWQVGFTKPVTIGLWSGLFLTAIIQGCYTNSSEVLFAAMTLYQLRILERLWGTRKFTVCCRYQSVTSVFRTIRIELLTL